MKRLIPAGMILILLSGVLAQAQTNQGNFLVGGNSNLTLNLGGEKDVYGSNEVKYNWTKVEFQPMAGYFIIDNLAGGLFFNVSLESFKVKDTDGKYKECTYALGPFFRYYAFPYEKIRPFAHVHLGIGGYKEKWDGGDYKEGFFTTVAGVGADYFFSDRVAGEILMGFNHESWKVKDDDSESRDSDDIKYIYNSFLFRLGINVIIGRN